MRMEGDARIRKDGRNSWEKLEKGGTEGRRREGGGKEKGTNKQMKIGGRRAEYLIPVLLGYYGSC